METTAFAPQYKITWTLNRFGSVLASSALSAVISSDAKLPALAHHRRIRREQVVVATDTASTRTAGRNDGRVGQSIPGRFNEQQGRQTVMTRHRIVYGFVRL